MQRTLRWLYRKLAARYFPLFLAFEWGSAAIITLATVGLLALYEDMSTATFLRLTAVAQACVGVALVYTTLRTRGIALPLIEWVRRGRDPEGAPDAWRRAVASRARWWCATGSCRSCSFRRPRRCTSPGSSTCRSTARRSSLAPRLWRWPTQPSCTSSCRAVPAAGGGGHQRAAPPDFAGSPVGVPLRWKLLGALPLINVITGVVVSGLSTGTGSSLNDLGLDVIVAVAVAFTISLELTVLVTKSTLGPVMISWRPPPG